MDPNAPLTPVAVKQVFAALAFFVVVCGLGGIWAMNYTPPPTTEAQEPSATPRDIRMGSSPEDVRQMLGEPDNTQEMRTVYGNTDVWYYSGWQVMFDNGRVTSVSRF